MDKLDGVFPIFLGLCGAGIGYFLGGFDTALYTLITFLILDYVTGVLVALKNKKFNYDVGFWGIFKKLFVLILIGIGAGLDNVLGGQEAVVRMTLIFFYLGIEGLSILQNASSLGIPIPSILTNWFDSLKKEGEKS